MISLYKNMDEDHKCTADQKEPDLKKDILYYSIYKKFKTRQS